MCVPRIEDSAESLLRPRLPSHLYVHVPSARRNATTATSGAWRGCERTVEVVFRPSKSAVHGPKRS
jgi:hypothetical protein